MKGYFTIASDYYTGELSFGKLGFDKGGLGYIQDCLSNNSRVGALIAHDVVEHSIAHRTNTYVTFEDEIRALGACSFVRGDEGFDMHTEIGTQLEHRNRSIKPVPRIMGKFLLEEGWVSANMMREAITSFGCCASDARNAAYQFAWGAYQKHMH